VALLVALRVGVAVREPEAEQDADALTEEDGDELALCVADRELEGDREAVAVALAVALIDELALAVIDGVCTTAERTEGCACGGRLTHLAKQIPAYTRSHTTVSVFLAACVLDLTSSATVLLCYSRLTLRVPRLGSPCTRTKTPAASCVCSGGTTHHTGCAAGAEAARARTTRGLARRACLAAGR
jgi:hypothetical protein